MVSELGLSFIFPPTVLQIVAPFPPLGPSDRFPSIIGTTRRSDFSPPIPRHFVSFVRRYRFRGGGEISQVPGEPSLACTCSSTPVGPLRQAIGHVPFSSAQRCCLPFLRLRRLPRLTPYEAQSHGPRARCLRFVVTVARVLLHDHARLASGWWPTLAGRDFNPRVRSIGFSHLICITS